MTENRHERPCEAAAADSAATRIANVLPTELFEASPIATFIIDTRHVLTHMNRACAITLGVDAQELVGTRSLGRLFYGQDRPVMADLIVDGGDASQFETWYPGACRRSTLAPDAFEGEGFFPTIGANGRWLAFTAAPLRDRNGALVGAIETLLDITERKRTDDKVIAVQRERDAQLSRAHDQLAQADKLTSIGQLAAGVAHEINNPIGYVYSNFGALERYLESVFGMLAAYEAAETSLDSALTIQELRALKSRIDLDYLKRDIPALMRESREGIERVRKIVQDLKDFSRVDSAHEWQFVDLVRCIDSTVNVVNNEIKYKADLVREYTDVPDVECRASEINQVIMNLVINAAQAMGPERGTITLRNGTDGRQVWFEVRDNGCGIAPENIARIFEPFFTTKPVGKGTGLGLSISHGIVQKHHGHITVASDPATGTSIRVSLPIVQPVPVE